MLLCHTCTDTIPVPAGEAHKKCEDCWIQGRCPFPQMSQCSFPMSHHISPFCHPSARQGGAQGEILP